MPQIRNLHILERRKVKVERTTGGAVRGTIVDVYHDSGGHPVFIVVDKNNGDRHRIPWHAVRSIVDEND